MRPAITKTLHHRACHLCVTICGLTIEITLEHDASVRISSVKGYAQDTFSRGHRYDIAFNMLRSAT